MKEDHFLLPRTAKKTLPVARRHDHYPEPLSFLPTELWQYIFILCLCPTDNHPSPTSAPLLLCRVCSAWRCLATITPHLWRSIAVTISLRPAPHPDLNMVSLWLERSRNLPVSLSLFQFNNSDESRDMVKEVLHLFSIHGSRWQRLDFLLPELRATWISGALSMCAPILEEFHVRTYDQPGEDLFESFRSPTPLLSSIAISSLPLGLLRGSQVPVSHGIPWSQLLNLSIGSVPSVHDALTVLCQCTRLQKCEIGIAGDSNDDLLVSMVCNKSLRELTLHARCADFGDFLDFIILPGLDSFVIYGRSPELSYWPYNQFVGHLRRSNTRLKALCIYTAWLWKPQYSAIFNQPSLQSLVKLIIDDDLEWDSVPCFVPIVAAILQAHQCLSEHVIPGIARFETTCVLPCLEALEITGHLPGIDTSTLLDMAESRWILQDRHIARLKILRVKCHSQRELTAKHRSRMVQLRKAGMKLYIS